MVVITDWLDWICLWWYLRHKKIPVRPLGWVKDLIGPLKKTLFTQIILVAQIVDLFTTCMSCFDLWKREKRQSPVPWLVRADNDICVLAMVLFEMFYCHAAGMEPNKVERKGTPSFRIFRRKVTASNSPETQIIFTRNMSFRDLVGYEVLFTFLVQVIKKRSRLNSSPMFAPSSSISFIHLSKKQSSRLVRHLF